MGGLRGSGLVTVSSDLSVLDSEGRWAVAVPYTGAPVLARFSEWQPWDGGADGAWSGPPSSAWTSSLDERGYVAAVEAVREAIAEGTVYQANVCRILSAPLGPDGDVIALHARLAAGNPSPYGGALRLPREGVHIACASPELFLHVAPRVGDGAVRTIRSGPIKGTGRTAADLTDKDQAENIMIVDLVRNDLSRVCRTGSVDVPELLQVQAHPGLVHLVSYVEGTLSTKVGWQQMLQATFPPGSVTGAPKSSALRLIDAVETQERGVYCGAFGWVDADTGEAELAVAIRTFWHDGHTLRFGTGAGITWESDAAAEWRETELKAERLIALASGA